MNQKALVVSVSTYDVVDQETKQTIRGKSCFYLVGDNVHPVKLNIKIDDMLYDEISKPGVYEFGIALSANTKGQMKMNVLNAKYLKEFSVNKQLA